MSRLTQAGQVGEYEGEELEEVGVKKKGAPPITKMTNAAWDVLEYLMTNPGGSQKDAATHVGLTQAYVSRVVNSPCYQLEVRKIRKNRMDEKLAAAGESSVDRLKKITEDVDSADEDAIAASKVVLTAMGYVNAGGGGGVSVNVNTGGDGTASGFGVSAEMIEEARLRREEKLIGGIGYVEKKSLPQSE